MKIRAHRWISVDLRRGGEQELRADLARALERVQRAFDTGPDRPDRVALVVHGRGRAREVIDVVHLDHELLVHVVAQELEARMTEESFDVSAPAREQVVQADHRVPGADQPLAQVRAEKARTTGHEHARKLHRDDSTSTPLLRYAV